MKPESIPYYAVALGILFAVGWWFDSRDSYTFEEPKAKQFCHPAAGKGFVYVTLREEQKQ